MESELKICSWNIGLGSEIDKIIKVIGSHPDFKGLDFLALQEASVSKEGEDNSSKIALTLGSNYGSFQQNYANVLGKVQGNGLVWNSARVKVHKKHTVTLPNVSQTSPPYWERLFLERFMYKQDRNYIETNGMVDNYEFIFGVTHLDTLGIIHKQKQFEFALAELLKNDDVGFTVLAGDFNTHFLGTWPSWNYIREIAFKYGLVDVTSDIKWTYKSMVPNLKLDSIFVKSGNLLQHKSWSLNVAGSDHIPLFTRIHLK